MELSHNVINSGKIGDYFVSPYSTLKKNPRKRKSTDELVKTIVSQKPILGVSDRSAPGRIVIRIYPHLKAIGSELTKNNSYIKIDGAEISICTGEVPNTQKLIDGLTNVQLQKLMKCAIDRNLTCLTNYLLTLDWKPLAVKIKMSPKFLLDMVKTYGYNPKIKDFILEQKKIKYRAVSFNTSINPEDLDIYKELIKYGYKPEVEILTTALLSIDYTLSKVILDSVKDSFLEANSKAILTFLKDTEDPISFELIRDRFPKIGSLCPLDLLIQSISDGKEDFIYFLLNNGLHLTERQIDENNIFKLALNSHNLRLIRMLCTYAESQGIKHTPYPAILDLDNSFSKRDIFDSADLELEGVDLTECDTNLDKTVLDINNRHLEQTLFRYAMSSPLEEIYQLANAYRPFYAVLHKVVEKISTVVRFPSLSCAQDMDSQFTDRASYEKHSEKYGDDNVKFIKSQYSTIKGMSRSELMTSIMENRYGRMAEGSRKKPYYLIKRTDPQHITKIHSTPLFRYRLWQDGDKQRDGPNRYHWALRHVCQFLYNPLDDLWKVPKNFEGSGENYQFSYVIPGSNEKIKMTRMKDGTWFHPDVEAIKKLQDHLEDLHQKIMGYRLDRNDPENTKKSSELVARPYWLQATLCEPPRGTPHNVMMWLNIVYKYLGLPPPIPKRNHFFLDNTMIMLPVEEVIERWPSFFEPTLDEALKFTTEAEKRLYFQDLFKANSELTKLCFNSSYAPESSPKSGKKSLSSASSSSSSSSSLYSVSNNLQTSDDSLDLDDLTVFRLI